MVEWLRHGVYGRTRDFQVKVAGASFSKEHFRNGTGVMAADSKEPQPLRRVPSVRDLGKWA